jgi:hypothetical protein
MKDTEQIALIHALADRLKETARELLVYQLFAQILKSNGAVGVEKLLDQARQSPALQEGFDTNFEGLDEFLPPLPGKTLNEEIQRFFEKWNPTGKPN